MSYKVDTYRNKHNEHKYIQIKRYSNDTHFYIRQIIENRENCDEVTIRFYPQEIKRPYHRTTKWCLEEFIYSFYNKIDSCIVLGSKGE